ncbi:MAG TPA: phenylalanine--tRNA ligase subunit alpha [Gemmatimonadaceae bacterium]|jgi:phenylalanyl-tRNA synthetase alpha chain
MNLQDYLNEAESIEHDGTAAITAATDADALEQARIAFLGDRQGRVKALQEGLRGISKEDKPAAGKRFNEARTKLEALLAERKTALAHASAGASSEDLSLPARRQWTGAKHPVTLVIEEIEGIFRELGFSIAQGPEAESDWYNFGALNFPPNHPALDAHDTLYLEDGGVLRTHTSPVQVRTLQKYEPPIRVLIPGNVYRRDFFDASHAPMFAQIEGLCVDEGISFVDLKSTLNQFAERFFGAAKTRFRPSFFPFTEPSAEMDVQCGICGGSGCAACKGTGWIEILGAGMVHPNVLEAAGVDSEKYTGWAFGMGPGRIAISRYGIPDIRILYDSDVRFLEQISAPATNGGAKR